MSLRGLRRDTCMICLANHASVVAYCHSLLATTTNILFPLLEGHRKRTAFAGFTDNIQASLMLLDDLAYDGESQADTSEKIVLMFFKMIETVKDARHIFWRNAYTVIFHCYKDRVVFFVQADFHHTTLGAKLDRVIHQSHQCALKGFGIT